MQACTIIAKNYAAFARVLAQSFHAQHPGGRFYTFVVDEWNGYLDPASEPFEILGPDTVQIPEFEAMCRRYDVLELSTAVKPWVMRHLIRQAAGEGTLYLDPDIRIYDSLEQLGELAVSHGVVLIPHTTRPIPQDGRQPSENDILAAGVYNLGFIGLASHDRVDELLSWWGNRLEANCRLDPARGFFVDQRLIDLVPGLLDAAIVRDPGYDVAYWNLHYRVVSKSDGGYLVNGAPLRFFHFSGYNPAAPHHLSKHQNRIHLYRAPVIRELCEQYRDELSAAGYEETRGWPYEPLGARPSRTLLGTSGVRHRSPQRQPAAPRRRSLGRRILDLENLVDGLRMQGESKTTITREALAAVSPLRGRKLAHRRRNPRVAAHGDLTLGVNVVGYLNGEVGVGEVARQTITALRASSVPVDTITTPAAKSRNQHSLLNGASDEGRHPINLVCVNADVLPEFHRKTDPAFFRDRFTVGLWQWEVNAFPDAFLSAFDYVDEVWACSRHTAEALRRLSNTEVTQVRIPVVPTPPSARDRKALGLPDGYTFLFVFDYLSVFERKNPLGLIYAFAQAFRSTSGPSLVIKTINAEQRSEDHALLLAEAEAHPNIRVIDGYLDSSDKNALLASCDCYVSLHRAEGFGLTLAEAMYFERPVIATGYSGNLDFMSPETGYLVDYDLTPIGPGSEPYPLDGHWAEPDLEHASRLMRDVFEQPDKARQVAARGAAELKRSHSPEAAGATMRSRLEQILTR